MRSNGLKLLGKLTWELPSCILYFEDAALNGRIEGFGDCVARDEVLFLFFNLEGHELHEQLDRTCSVFVLQNKRVAAAQHNV